MTKAGQDAKDGGGPMVVLLMALGFGLVGVDRFLISTLYPTIARDLHLNYADIGTITGALAIAWGLSALFMGDLADRIGRRQVLVGALVLFSLLIGASGLATSLAGLILVRIVMGAADGGFAPASISATLEASPPHRQGRNIGLQQMTLTLFGLGLAPLLVAELLHVLNWRLIFSIFVIPGLILSWLVWRTVPARGAQGEAPALGRFQVWRQVLGFHNVPVLMACMLCWLICLITTSAFMPNYLLDYLKLDFGAMSAVMSAIGFGSATGSLLLPWLSDYLGRRTVMILATVGAFISLIVLRSCGPSAGQLFAALFAVHVFNNALITLTVGPVCSESVPRHLTATASGVIIAFGELVGGGVAQIFAGGVAQRFGIEQLLWLPMAALAAGFLLCLLALRETRAGGGPADTPIGFGI